LMGRIGRDAEQRLSLRSTEHASNRTSSGDGNALELPAFEVGTNERVFLEKADPYRVLAVKTDAVRFPERAKAAMGMERAIIGDCKARQAIALALGDDEGLAVAGYRDAVGKAQSFGNDLRTPVTIDEKDATAMHRGVRSAIWIEEVDTEI